ncbi:MAG: hypothetical protein ACLQHS_07315 [Candidatus Limnocylindrales bacterium]
MSDQMLRLVVGGVLLVHGLGHGGALAALVWLRLRPGANTGDWLPARSWLIPSLPADTAMTLASACWIVALVGFVIAALSFWGILVPEGVWQPLAVGTALVSLAGIVFFLGTWPAFSTVAAIGVNVAVVVAVLWLHWPPETLFTR